jgi:hypothetical protein
VTIVQHEPVAAPTSTEMIEAAINRIRGKSLPKPDEPDNSELPSPNRRFLAHCRTKIARHRRALRGQVVVSRIGGRVGSRTVGLSR